MRTEEQIIEYESELIAAMDKYFNARVGTVERTSDRERRFEGGFRLAWEAVNEKFSTRYCIINSAIDYMQGLENSGFADEFGGIDFLKDNLIKAIAKYQS